MFMPSKKWANNHATYVKKPLYSETEREDGFSRSLYTYIPPLLAQSQKTASINTIEAEPLVNIPTSK